MSAVLLAIALTLCLISGFNSKAEIDERQVFAFPEGNGTKTFLVRIEYFNVDPKKANVTVPPKPTTRKPGQPTTGGPIQPGSDKCKLNNGMNDAIRNDFLNEHNRLRSFTAKGLAKNPLGTNGYAPKGAKILKMVYDCSVEETAAIHANKCEFKHTVGGKNGENLWAILPKHENLTGMGKTATYSWFTELEKFGMPPDNILTDEIWNRPKMPVGHYTQVVYESSYKLGCGIAVCSDMTFVVCQYSPPGNYIGSIIYTIGEPCKSDEDCKCDGCKCSRDEALCIKPN